MYISAVKRAFKVIYCFITYLSKKEDESNFAIFGKSCLLKKMPQQHTEKIEWETLLGKIALVTDAVTTAALTFCSCFDKGSLT